ncbi:hypothetical protein QTP88_026721 [Uroleucon formosanum]
MFGVRNSDRFLLRHTCVPNAMMRSTKTDFSQASPSRNLDDPPSPPLRYPRSPLPAVAYGRARSFAGHDSSAKAFSRVKINGSGGDDNVCGGGDGGGGPPTSYGNTEVSEMGGTFRRRRRTGLSCVACARDRVCVSVRCACVQVSMRLYMLSRRARVIDPHCGMRLQRVMHVCACSPEDAYVQFNSCIQSEG